MRRPVEDLRTFYGEPAGAAARAMVARRLSDAWGEADACDVLGLGYATPWLDAFVGARRVVAAMPGGQGVETWPTAGKTSSLLVEETRLPFAAGAFDRILLIHALEEAESPAALLTEAVRALAPAGRIIIATAARGGFWARAESTPFGHGRPFTRGQLERLVREAELEPLAWSHTLFTPPWTPVLGLAERIEPIAARILPGAAGIILLEASRRIYATKRVPKGRRVAVTDEALAPQALGAVADRMESDTERP